MDSLEVGNSESWNTGAIKQTDQEEERGELTWSLCTGRALMSSVGPPPSDHVTGDNTHKHGV